jgi:acyl-CoA synthetase (AMP-forming)/AMP-acid ligase II
VILRPTSELLLGLQGRRGDAQGVFAGDDHIPYGAIHDAAVELDAWLGRRRYESGRLFGVMAGNHPGFVSMLFGVWGIGGVHVPISIRSTAEEVARILVHARADTLLCDDERAPVAREAARAAGIPAVVCSPRLPLAPRVLHRRPLARRRATRTPIAAIAYTSGTTGSPKGVVLTHEGFLVATLACGLARGDTRASVGSCLSPLTHTPVLISHLICRIFFGSGVVLFERFDLDAVLEGVERRGITDLTLIGGMVFDVVARGSVPPGVRRSVRKVSVGGAPTPMEAKHKLAGIFPEAEIIEAYGQTESTDGVTMARGTSVFDREGTIGYPNPFILVEVHRPDGGTAEVGEEGEIVVGGPTVMARYHRDARATKAALRGGWLHTGDLGRRDADGWFYITGRLKDLIITGGENVAPGEVEDVLRTHPDVADVAVIGTPHPRWGEQVTAIVVPRDGVHPDADALVAFAGARLAGFKKPRRIEFVAVLPRNALNKVQTTVLRQRFGA